MKSVVATAVVGRERKIEVPLVPQISTGGVEEKPTKEMTVGYILRETDNGTEVLLGLRDKYALFQPSVRNGPGGKLDPAKDDDMMDCLVRELREEVGVRVHRKHAVHIATIEFFDPRPGGYRSIPDCRVHFYNIHKWTCRGEPKPRERKKKGFSRVDWFLTKGMLHEDKSMPYPDMNGDVKLWHLERLLDNEQTIMKGQVWYADDKQKKVYQFRAEYIPRPLVPVPVKKSRRKIRA